MLVIQEQFSQEGVKQYKWRLIMSPTESEAVLRTKVDLSRIYQVVKYNLYLKAVSFSLVTKVYLFDRLIYLIGKLDA